MDRRERPGATRPRVAARRHPGRWLRRHPVSAALGLALGLLLLGAVVDLLRVRADIDGGRAALSGLSLDTLGDGLVPTIDGAAARLSHADRVADRSPFLATVGILPGVRDQVQGLRDLTEVTEQLGASARAAAANVDVQLERASGEPSARVDLLDTVLEELDRVEQTVAGVDVGARGDLVGPLADARHRVVAELASVPRRLDEARGYLHGMRRLLAGPSHYLLLGANNAEMRGGAGMPLSAGVVTIEDGDIDFGEFTQLSGLRLGQPVVRYPDEWSSTYRRWRIGRSYLETAVSPNFTITGPMYQAMAPNAGFGTVDGVLEVDAVALRELLGVIGPVVMDGVTYDADNVEQRVLNESYITFQEADDRGDRVEVQSRLAKRIFEAFKEREVPVSALASALQQAATGRHLLASSADPDVQALWTSIGADGALPPTGLMVTAQNLAANKLDWYLDPRVSINVLRPGDGGPWTARLTVTITNPAPERTSPYIDGSYDGLTNGTHRTMVAVYLPAAAYGVRSLDLPFSEGGADPPLQMFAKRLEIPRGETRRVALEFKLPPEHVGAVVLPSGRVRPVSYQVNGVDVTDAAPAAVYWLQRAEPSDTPGEAAVAALLALAGAVALVVGGRARLRLRATPERPLGIAAQHAPLLGGLLFAAALAVEVTGILIDRFW